MRELLERKRAAVVAQMAKLEAKLAVYDELLVELSPVVVPSLTPETTALSSFVPVEKVEWAHLTEATPKAEKRPYTPRASRPKSVVEIIELALEAAGDRGATAREVAEVASLPSGTVSGRLSVMKFEGRVKHIAPRYFAVHSKSQDNNDDQGMDVS